MELLSMRWGLERDEGIQGGHALGLFGGEEGGTYSSI